MLRVCLLYYERCAKHLSPRSAISHTVVLVLQQQLMHLLLPEHPCRQCHPTSRAAVGRTIASITTHILQQLLRLVVPPQPISTPLTICIMSTPNHPPYSTILAMKCLISTQHILTIPQETVTPARSMRITTTCIPYRPPQRPRQARHLRPRGQRTRTTSSNSSSNSNSAQSNSHHPLDTGRPSSQPCNFFHLSFVPTHIFSTVIAIYALIPLNQHPCRLGKSFLVISAHSYSPNTLFPTIPRFSFYVSCLLFIHHCSSRIPSNI
ncbi:hypothetical protein BX666DRAFT_952700 [Dichotomocladium elegans]|nr:hypothetical protein BX666DRAFT_952700 [Dichotomocladium elegans]